MRVRAFHVTDPDIDYLATHFAPHRPSAGKSEHRERPAMTLTSRSHSGAAGAAASSGPAGPSGGRRLHRVVVQMVRRAASPGFESWWRKAENVGFCANPIHLTGTDTFGAAASGVDPLQQPPRRRVPVVLGSVCPRHLAARARRRARRASRHAVHHRRAPAGVRHIDRTQLRARAHQPRRHKQ